MALQWKDIAVVLPLVCGVSAVGYAIYVKFLYCKKDKNHVNTKIDKDCPKIVHSFDIEDLGTKAVFCRCWKSEKFPYCDGSHNKHNESTGDNVGPLILKHKDA